MVFQANALFHVARAGLAEVGAAEQLADKHDVGAFDDFGPKRAVDCEFLEREAGAQIGKAAEGCAKAEQAGFGTLVRSERIELVAADSAEQNGIRCERGVKRFFWQGRAVFHNRDSADAGLEKMNSWPASAAVSFKTSTASRVTSGPMPSPAVTRIFSSIFSCFPQGFEPFNRVAVTERPGPLAFETASRFGERSIQFRDRLVAAFANLIGKQANQVLVVDVLLAIGQSHKAVVDVLQLITCERVAQLLKPMAQGRAAGVLAEYEMSFGDADQPWRHDFVAERVGQHAVLVNAASHAQRRYLPRWPCSARAGK